MNFTDHFFYVDGELCCDGAPISEIANRYPTPFYLYSVSHMQAQYAKLSHVFEKRAALKNALIAFAVKSCSNTALLQKLVECGAGADIVSEGELARALHAGVPANRIVFSGVGKTRSEIRGALYAGIKAFNVESLEELKVIAEIAEATDKKASVLIRLNPDVNAGTLDGISTGRKGDKFGMDRAGVKKAFAIGKELKNVTIDGISVHIGSQIFKIEKFRDAYVITRNLARELRAEGYAVKIIDCGGGFGIPYAEGEPVFDCEAYAETVNQIFTDEGFELIFEPGRFIAGNAGALVSEILYVKREGERVFLINDAGMNDLARPAIYGAKHEILALTEKKGVTECYDIVGPVCESTDTFGKQINLPVLQAGEKVAFLSAGAYGASMSSEYNSRPLIAEIAVDAGKTYVIRARQTIKAMIEREKAIAS